MSTNLWRFRVVTYSELSREIEQLSYRDKFRLAQLLIQLARKEEEEQNSEQRQKRGPSARLDPEMAQYVADRFRKLKPSKKKLRGNRCDPVQQLGLLFLRDLATLVPVDGSRERHFVGEFIRERRSAESTS
jgi:hypothetical protein